MVAAFEKATGIKVLMTRKSSGEFYAQLKAEAANPRGDIWWGGTGDPHLQAAEEGLTEPYKSPKLAELQDWAVRQCGGVEGPHGRRLRRRARLQLQHRPAEEEEHPRAEVLGRPHEARVQGRDPGREPELVGHVVHDARDVRAADGRGQGVRVPEGAAQERQPVHEVGRGAGARGGHRRELVGITFQHDAVVQAVGGAPVKIVSPCEGTGYEIGSMSIIKGAKNMENAKKWYDWALDARGAERSARRRRCPTRCRRTRTRRCPPQAPKLSEIKLINYDFAKYGSSAERKRLLTKWDKEVSTLPK